MDDRDDEGDRESLAPAIIFEFLVGLVAIGIAWGIGLWVPTAIETLGTPFHAPDLPSLAGGILAGLLWSLPLLVALSLLQRLPIPPLRRMQQWVDAEVAPQFSGRSLTELVLLAAGAGIGEELLFRWALQCGFMQAIGGTDGMLVGLCFGAILFGMVHAVSGTYGTLAALIGLFLGIELLVTQSLVAVITTHAFYDLVIMIGWSRRPVPTK